MSATIRARLAQITAAVAAALLAAGTAAPVQAADTRNETARTRAAADQARPSGNPNQRVCVVFEPVTGSRLTRRICKTRAAWEREGGVPTAE